MVKPVLGEGMQQIKIEDLMSAGAHFGHQSHRWHPKMRPYILMERKGIHIIDLTKTVKALEVAAEAVRNITAQGKSVLFVGTKKQAQKIIEEEATRCNMPYISNRWLGGTLTNFSTIQKSIAKMKELEKIIAEGAIERYVKKEALKIQRDLEKMHIVLNGIRDMHELPGCVFISDARKDYIAITEAIKLNIPIVSIVDTNIDPSNIDYVIPANDDSIRSLKLIISYIADSAIEGRALFNESISQIPIHKEEAPEIAGVRVRRRRTKLVPKPSYGEKEKTGTTSEKPKDEIIKETPKKPFERVKRLFKKPSKKEDEPRATKVRKISTSPKKSTEKKRNSKEKD